MAKRYTQEDKLRLLSAFKERTESATSFARRMGLSVGSLYRWEQELPLGGFCEVVAPGAPLVASSCPALTLDAGGVSVRFWSLPPGAYLVELLQGLGRC